MTVHENGGREQFEELLTDELSSVYTHRISSASGLESIDSTLSQGDVAYVEQPSTPYRTSSWIDIDTNHVTVVFESPYAKDGQPIVKIADGANVGGVRIGVAGSATVEDVTLRNYGHHGNDQNQTSGLRHHGVIVEDAENVVVEGCALTRTHPYNQHNDGGSGITVRHNAQDVRISNNYCFDIGDRGIQVAGDNITIAENVTVNGYDRGISMVVAEPDDTQYYARSVAVVGNYIRDNSAGSCIGVGSTAAFSNDTRSGLGHYAIVGNVGRGDHRRLVTIRGNVTNVVIVGNSGIKGGGDAAPGINISSAITGAVINGNELRGYDNQGIYIAGAEFTCNGNLVDSPGGDGISAEGSLGTIQANTVTQAGGHGIYSKSGSTTIGGNVVDSSSKSGLYLDATATTGVVGFNNVLKSDQNNNSNDEITIADSGLLVIGNRVPTRNGLYAFGEQSGANKNLYVGNRATDAIVNGFDIVGSNSWGYANFPALFDDEGSVTLSGGASPAARVDGISSTEGMGFNVRVQPDPASTQPSADYSWESYMEWDDSAGAWDLVVEWRTDPGSGNDVSALYEVTREPTSRGIKN